jgi:isoquinoline 1-oxidoreductase beta subunit
VLATADRTSRSGCVSPHHQTESTGVAVRAATFGQCIDAVRALRVSWKPGRADGKSDASVLKELKAAELPLGLPPLTPSVEERFTFHFRSNSALEPNCAIADVRPDRAEIWSSLKAPIVAKEAIAGKLGLPLGSVTVHVTEGGGSFGRKLFFDAALEAVEVSQKIGKPVKLMWHRADDSRQGRTHPMATSRVRIAYLGNTVLSYKQRHTSVATDLGHGLGEVFTAMAAKLPVGDIGFSETFFQLSESMPYNFGANSRLLNETDNSFNTGSMRNVYSPDVTCARELLIDQLAARMGENPTGSDTTSCGTTAPEPCSTRSQRSGAGAGACRPERRRASPSTPSTTPPTRCWWRSTAAPRRSTAPSATVSPAASPRRSSPWTSAWPSTRVAWRRR